jgi:hypothetical protein
MVGVDAVGADGAAWEDPPGPDFFAIQRPNGNPTNIPLDGTLGREMASATWTGGVPVSQTILLHINNAAECAALYGGADGDEESDTCWVRPGSPPPPPDPATLEILKFYDADADGTHDAGEVLITGWQVTYDSTVAYTPVVVDPIAPGDYTVAEGNPVQTNWIHTTPTSVSVTIEDGENEVVKFGNVCVGAGGGSTLGFWSNKNGQALVGPTDLAMLVSLNLVQGNSGSAFNPTTYAQLRTWLLNGNAVNMAYMLSVQLAAMELNVFNNKVNGGALIYAPGTTSANSLGFATINAVMAEANAELGLHPTAPAGSAWRSYQEALKNALDRANNNLNFVQSSPCPFSFAA